ncbi:MAG: phenylalanine--tRNA ligase subunit beta, partial [Clostridiales bacterium]|nr:phenylalanine--tRNA ligase subunit beta [Clostridiales bacterium]
KLPHPKSAKLSVCQIESGDGVKKVVCGAPNIGAGQKVALALPGASLPGGKIISPAEIAGTESHGMVCSAAELGIDEHAHEGIMVLPPELAAGSDLVEALGLADAVFELELTPNRSDCLGILNVAKEAAAICGLEVTAPNLLYPEKGGDISSMLELEVIDKDLCPRYTARLVTGVKPGPSPLWMQLCLLSAGMRPINNVVDIANFVMLEMNQPLHTFDYAKLTGKKITVRRAAPGEKIVTLDDKQRVLDSDTLVICDDAKPLCIAGVMGGRESEVAEKTTDVLIESACFNPAAIRSAARKYAIPSEASMRFEKGVDIESTDLAARRIAGLLVELCGGVAARGVLDAYSVRPKNKTIMLRTAKVNDLLGTAFRLEEIAGVMKRLAFPIEQIGDDLKVCVPQFRRDITQEVDLIEEVARLTGYENIPLTLPSGVTTQGGRSGGQALRGKTKELCAGLGLQEMTNYSFISPKEWERLLLPAQHPWRQVMTVKNPLNEEQSVMRTTLLPGLLNAATRNHKKRNTDGAAFELGTLFFTREQELPQEEEFLALLLWGKTPASWLDAPKGFDYFHMKGLWERLAQAFGLDFQLEQPPADEYPFLHPGKSALIKIGGKRAGFMGEAHPLAAENYELGEETVLLEISLKEVFAAAQAVPQASDLPKYPSLSRDMALLGDAAIPQEQITAAIRQAGGPYLASVRLFDVYDGPPIPEGRRSLAYALTFVHKERTLTDEEADKSMSNIVKYLQDKFGLRLR